MSIPRENEEVFRASIMADENVHLVIQKSDVEERMMKREMGAGDSAVAEYKPTQEITTDSSTNN